MSYTPEFIALQDPNRIVPLAEGIARLREIRESIEALPDSPEMREQVSAQLAEFRKSMTA